LVEAESTGFPVTVALNKADLVDEEMLDRWKFKLCSWGYDPLFCSAESKQGLDSLALILRDQTSVIVGPSGVGKSSLINTLRSTYLAPQPQNSVDPVIDSKWYDNQRIGEVSTRSGRGKHTTRHVSLLPLSGGGYLVDTPGFNQPKLTNVTTQSLAHMFPEIQNMLIASEPARCSFNNCLHLLEQGCLVKGNWQSERYPLYIKLLDEIKIREEVHLTKFGTKKEDDVRYKDGDMGVQQAEPRLEPKKHRRVSRKRINQSFLDEFDEEDDSIDEEDDPILRALRNEGY